ncbi:dTDP-4-dehydrorhamnose reductase [Calycomorphotria hydatis]|uniref:dTDP-4-dehydrorhamnose reductase n=1 Tax=Calycomorphotria hydatis TaxID=2528027 RepID=A0A517TEE9_9PLAN|nr:dTDP-4-dehydrorhamnose reductase [Calycomorphotria hydatis]QDT66746.1 dTDP-4-dehydrorhamnose reductase [Calycomorphotria hydatis]
MAMTGAGLRTVAVTGVTGQLGGEIARRLGKSAIGLSQSEMDLSEPNSVYDKLKSLQPETIIHCGAYTAVDRAEDDADQCWTVNADSTAALAQYCQDASRQLVYISTDYVFGGVATRSLPFREEDTPQADSVYAKSKLAGEQYVRKVPHHFIVRTCGLYGHGGRNFVETMLSLAQTRDSLRIVDDQHCTPSAVDDIAAAILYLVSTDAFGTYHISNTGKTTWCELAREIFRICGLSVKVDPITSDEYGAKAPRPKYSVLDTAKYHALGGPRMPAWTSAIAKYLHIRETRVS